MPVEVILDLSLFAFYEPTALTEIVIAYLFTQVKGFQEFLGLQFLFMVSYVDYHWALTGVTYDNAEQLLVDGKSFLGVLFEPMCLFLEFTQLTAMLSGISFKGSLKANIRVDENSRSLYCSESLAIGHAMFLHQVSHYNSSTSADPSGAYNEDIPPLLYLFFNNPIGFLKMFLNGKVRHVVNI
jgi:hypothetical protein